MIIRRTQRVVTGWSTANSGRMAAVTVVDRSGVPHVVLFPHGSIPQAATGRAEFEPTPSNAPFSRVETPGTYFTDPLYHPLDPENLPAYSIGDYNPNTEIKPVNAAENEANPQASSSASKPVLVSSCEHGTDRNEGSGSGPVQAAKTLSPPTRHLSIESLALKLNIPKLLNVSEGVPGVLELPYSELRDRYGITGEEFLKIKAHRKELEKEKNPETN
ncbi:hypothetical protein HDU84_001706 [Entophlyctis sp. JEL0112]|nr:hypothetical protein HDU84_001706 [Entophlyctis sp. JEL0112]